MLCEHVYCKLNPIIVWTREATKYGLEILDSYRGDAEVPSLWWVEGVDCRRREVWYRLCLRTTHVGLLEWELLPVGIPIVVCVCGIPDDESAGRNMSQVTR